jgi:hypothetical protein
MKHIEKITTEHTGGNCWVDVVHLKDGRCIAIYEDGLSVFLSFADFDSRSNNVEVLNFNPPLRKGIQ